MSKAPARVRGMNAAAAAAADTAAADTDINSGGTFNGYFGDAEHDGDDTIVIPAVRAGSGGGGADHGKPTKSPRFPHASMRQLMLAIVLLLVGLLIARFTYSEIAGGPAGFAGTIEPTNSVPLDFAQTGEVAQIMVKAGDHVTVGETLATLVPGSAQATLQDAQAVLAADKLVVQALQSPTLSPAEKQNLSLQVAAAGVQLANAQQSSQNANGQAQTLITQAQTVVNAAIATYNADSTEYNEECAGGNDNPGGNRHGGGGGGGNYGDNGGNGGDYGNSNYGDDNYGDNSTNVQAGDTSTQCATLAAQVQKDSAAVTSANADLANVKANAAALQGTAQSSAANASAALALAQNQEATQTSPASSNQIATAEANVASAQTTVDQDQAALSAMTLVSPIAGTVANVGGIAGDLDGTDGVHGFNGPSALQATSGPAFSLFPAESGASQSGSSTSSQPLIWLVSPQTYAMAQVSESEISNLHVGSAAQVTVNALGKTVNGTVEQINPIPVDQGGNVEYEVRLNVPVWPQGVMIGMSLNVTFH